MSGRADEECQFFGKVGACRHGNKCVRKHTNPESSNAIILVSMPLPLRNGRPTNGSTEIDQFVQDVFVEIALIAPIKEIFLTANESPHLKGNIYVSFASRADAANVLTNMNSRWFKSKPIFAIYYPSQSLAQAVCREGETCRRKMDCNYVHPLEVNKNVWTKLFAAQAKEYQSQPTK